MWKILAAFIIFAVVALAAVFSMGDKANMQGESGGHTDAKTEAPAAAPAEGPATAAAAPAAAEADKK